MRKAQENFICASYAADKGRLNVAASRFYYAIFLAVKEYVQLKEPDVAPEDLEHGRIPFKLAQYANKRGSTTLMVGFYKLRRQADYDRISVREEEIAGRRPEIRELLNFLYGELIVA